MSMTDEIHVHDRRYAFMIGGRYGSNLRDTVYADRQTDVYVRPVVEAMMGGVACMIDNGQKSEKTGIDR